MEDKEKRFAELEERETLTDAEMQELLRLAPPGRYVRLPDMPTLGVVSLDQAVRNLKDCGSRSKKAYEGGCFIEVISLRLQFLDFWLRIFWVARNKKGQIFDSSDRRTFGALIADCEKLGFDAALIHQMRTFNDSRVDSIHKYLLGAITYGDLKVVCDAHEGLVEEIAKYVGPEVGKPLPPSAAIVALQAGGLPPK